jgi:hypothetical protein
VSPVDTHADPEAAYYQAVEEYFVSRRGDPLFLSNADWNLVRKWRLAGIPLRVVLRGIRDALDAHAHGWSRDRKVGSLGYCAREVDVARERWERSLTLGRGEGADAASALAAFASQLEQASGLGPRGRAVADAVAQQLRTGPVPVGLAGLTQWLAARERELLAAIAAEEPAARCDEREREVAAQLEPWRGRMPARVLEQIRVESLARRALEAHGLSRLSLFHLEGGGGVGA